MRVPKSLLPVVTFARIDIKRLFRDKVAIFFTFIFPLIFLLIFGSIFSNNDNISFNVALLQQSETPIAKQVEAELRKSSVLKIEDEVQTLDEAKLRMERSTISATIVLPPTFGATEAGATTPTGQIQVLYDQNNEQAGRTLATILDSALTGLNGQFVDISQPFTVKAESTMTEGLTQFDYTFAGLLGFTLLSLGIFGPTSVFPRLKTRGVIRRYHTTTLKVWQYFTGNVISNGFTGILAVSVMFAAAITIFDLNVKGNLLAILLLVILGATLMFGIGLAIGGWAKNENQAAPLSQLVALPMMFLSGVFFPTFLMPEFLQFFTRFLPLTPIVDSFRMVVIEGKSLLDIGIQLAMILAWTLVVYIIAFRVFRWE